MTYLKGFDVVNKHHPVVKPPSLRNRIRERLTCTVVCLWRQPSVDE